MSIELEPMPYPKELIQWVDKEVFFDREYVFVTREDGYQVGYCTHCGCSFEPYVDNTYNMCYAEFNHNDSVICPNCNSAGVVKKAGYGRKKLVLEAYVVFYQKDPTNSNAIVARGVYLVRDFTGDYKSIKTQLIDAARFKFEVGEKSLKIVRRVYYYDIRKGFGEEEWQEIKTISSYIPPRAGSVQNSYIWLESIQEAVSSTPFEYSCWNEYIPRLRERSFIEFFDLYSKYPWIEYMTKMGFQNIIAAKINDNHWHPMYSVINWRGRAPEKILRISKKNIKEIRRAESDVTPLLLKLFQILEVEGVRLQVSEVEEISREFRGRESTLFEILEFTKLKDVWRYIKKQCRKYPEYNRSYGETLGNIRDYYKDCLTLNMDMQDDSVLHPGCLHRAHLNTTKQIKIKSDKKLDKKIKKRLKELTEKYYLELNGLLIRPADSTEELIIEGRYLNHCVGSYGADYANGETDILLIRKTDEPEMPYYTAEVFDGIVRQVRGLKNYSPTKEVDQFIEIFKTAKLGQQIQKTA